MKNDNKIKIKPELARQHGIELDPQGFPTPESLKAYHEKNNPQAIRGQRAIRLTDQPATKPN